MREAHARDFIAKPVRPKIMDEEFPEYPTLLDAMEVEVPLITLPCLSPLAPNQTAPLPASSELKRRADKEHTDLEDTGASTSGAPPSQRNAATTTETDNLDGAPVLETEEDVVPPTRDEAVTAFLASPLLLEADELRIDHISALMVLISADNGGVQKQAIILLSMEYDQGTAYLIWQAWAPHISPPEEHPLAVGTLAKDLVMATLITPFPTAMLAKSGATALTDAIADAISPQTFIDHKDQDLDEETEMEVLNTPLPLSCPSKAMLSNH